MKINLPRRRLLFASVASYLSTGFHHELKAADLPNHDIRIATADEAESTKRIIEGLQKRYPSSQVIVDYSSPLPKRKNTIYVAVGPAALRSLLSKDIDSPILSLFTSSQAYRSILESFPKRSGAITAIYAEPSPLDQMHMISALYKRRVSVAALISDKTTYLVPTLRSAAAAAGIDLELERVDSDENLNRALNRVSSATVILAVPDTTVYNVENIRNILVTSYRHNQPVVGFSTALVKAGALATTYSSIEDILAQGSELLSEYVSSSRLPEPQFPKYFSVSVNDSVARSLNLVIDDTVRRLARKPGGKA